MATTSQAYWDVVGGTRRSWPKSYDDAIDRVCPTCGAEALDLCINPIHGKPRKTPCVARVRPWN
jgi:hypothetical protein